MREILTTVADTAARTTQCVLRRSPLGGATFSQTVVFGFLGNPGAFLRIRAASNTRPEGVPIPEHGAQYDHIGSKYDEYARTATLKRAESYTFFRMVGALAGQRVLELACGFGFYTHLLKQRGAAQVIGVAISPEMIRLARQ
jgi:SAM-dependent methyltransferase